MLQFQPFSKKYKDKWKKKHKIIILLIKNGNTLLIKSIEKQIDTDYVYMLLEKGADVNLANDNGETPLHWACIRVTKSKSAENIKIIETLIDNGADIQAKTTVAIEYKDYYFSVRSTPLDIIKIKNAREIEKVLTNY